MRHLKLLRYYLFLLLFLFLACQGRPDSGPKVIGVMDGDTVELLENNQPVRVRLYGVDAPEKNQDYGTRARQFASDLAFGKNVQLIEKGKDRYGRIIGIIILPDGRSLNEELVRNGYAWHYTAFSKDQNLARLEEEARQHRRGLWEMPNPTPPWEFRQSRRTNRTTASAPLKKAPSAPTPRYGPALAGSTVYICDSRGATAYHTSPTCRVLNRCKSEIIQIPLQQALDGGRRPDKVCVAP
jgi:micrococcal nuclease